MVGDSLEDDGSCCKTIVVHPFFIPRDSDKVSNRKWFLRLFLLCQSPIFERIKNKQIKNKQEYFLIDRDDNQMVRNISSIDRQADDEISP